MAGRGKKEKKKIQSITKMSSPNSKVSTNDRECSVLSNKENEKNICEKVFQKSAEAWPKGACTLKQTPTYTGTKVIGIAIQHKSCLQPIFSKEEAMDSARMRR